MSSLSSPVVYVDSFDGTLIALDAQSGAQRWVFHAGDVVLPPTLVAGVVYVSSIDHHVNALDARTGRQRWRFQAEQGVSTPPVVAAGMVYVGSLDDFVYALDARTGRQRWRYDTERQVITPLIVTGGALYVACTWGLCALDAHTGQSLWDYPGDGSLVPNRPPPAVVDGVVYDGFEDQNPASDQRHVYAVAAGTGMYVGAAVQRWGFRIGGDRGATPDNISATPVVAAGVVYVGTASYDHTIYALDARTGKERWHFRMGDESRASPILLAGLLYVGSYDHNLYALDARTGSLRWRFHAGGPIDASLVAAGSVLYVSAEDGHIYALDRHTGHVYWRFSTGAGDSAAPSPAPALVGGLLLVRGYVPGKPLDLANGIMPTAPIFSVYAVDAGTGRKRWQVRLSGAAVAICGACTGAE